MPWSTAFIVQGCCACCAAHSPVHCHSAGLCALQLGSSSRAAPGLVAVYGVPCMCVCVCVCVNTQACTSVWKSMWKADILSHPHMTDAHHLLSHASPSSAPDNDLPGQCVCEQQCSITPPHLQLSCATPPLSLIQLSCTNHSTSQHHTNSLPALVGVHHIFHRRRWWWRPRTE